MPIKLWQVSIHWKSYLFPPKTLSYKARHLLRLKFHTTVALISLACAFFSCVLPKGKSIILSHQPWHSKQRPWKLTIRIATCQSAILNFVKKAWERLMWMSRSVNSIAWKRWLLWRKWILLWKLWWWGYKLVRCCTLSLCANESCDKHAVYC